MQRYFIKQLGQLNQIYILSKEDSHHIKNVMRSNQGDKLIGVFDNQVFLCEVIIIDKNVQIKTIEVINSQVEIPLDITIATGITKGDKYEYVLQKATELGCHHFILLDMERSVAKLTESKVIKKIERWHKIIKEAAEQSHRNYLPDIIYFNHLDKLIHQLDQYDYCLLAYEEAAKQNETSRLAKIVSQAQSGDKILCIVGPEGGISEKELQKLTTAKVISIGLGPRILRAETAPLYFLSVLSFMKELY